MVDEAQNDDGIEGFRALTPVEERAVADNPMPEGVPDALVNKYQLADALDVSQTTLTNWIRAGLPVEVEGANGRQYQFRLSLCFAWSTARRRNDEAERARSEDASKQLRLAILGEDQVDAKQASLSLKEQRELLETAHAYHIAARDRGELLKADITFDGLQEVFLAMRDGLDALPDVLARELGLDGRGVEKTQGVCDEVLIGLERAIRGLIGQDAEIDLAISSGQAASKLQGD